MAGAMRFTTQELVETESRIVSAAERALALEQDIFAELAAAVAAQERALGEVAGALAELDCEAALAEVAVAARAIRGPSSTTAPPSRSWAAAIRWSSRRCEPRRTAPSSSTTTARLGGAQPDAAEAGCDGRSAPRACGSSPAPTWPASPPSCARTR